MTWHLSSYVFLLFLAKLAAASFEPNPHAFNANANLVGLPFLSFIGPDIPAKRAANETRLGFVPELTGLLRLDPSLLLKNCLPLSLSPPLLF